EVVLRAVLATAEAEGILPLRWNAHLALGVLARNRRGVEEAEREFAAARVAIESFAAGIDDATPRERVLISVTRRRPGARPLSPRRAAKGEYDGLTAREREVAVRVAGEAARPGEGLTPGESSLGASQTTGAGGHGLTGRELDVLGLVVDRLT